MARKALIVFGGWDGHQPRPVAELFAGWLKADGFDVEMSDSLDAFKDRAKLLALDLIIPHWTMGSITDEQANPVFEAVAGGVGIAGVHGGLCDAFRAHTEWQFMTGGQFVAHPGNHINYRVKIGPVASELTRGIGDFDVTSEQYYMHVDPAVKVLATTQFPVANGPHASNGLVEMPVIWTKLYGRGRVYYNSLGHDAQMLQVEPIPTLIRRGFIWAASGK